MSTLSRAGDMIYTYRFLKVLTTPWEKMEAYELGLIDEKGKRTGKKPKTPDEKSAYTLFHRMVFNLKRMVEKVPGGKAKYASFAAALFLLREHTNLSEKELADALHEAGIERGDDVLNESWMLEEETLGSGRYVLTEDIMSPKTGELISKAGSTIIVGKDCNPVDTIFEAHIYKVMHEHTKQDIYVTVADIKR